MGQNKAIVLTNGALGQKTLTQTFNYAGAQTIGSSITGGGGGCSANDGASPSLLVALLILLGALAASLAFRRAWAYAG